MAWKVIQSATGSQLIIPEITTENPHPQVIAEVDQPEHANLLVAAPDLLDALQAIADLDIEEANAQMAGDAIAIASHAINQLA